MSTFTPEEDEVFAAFALGEAKQWITTHSEDLGHGNTALVSHGVTIALRSEHAVVFDAAPHRDGERCVCRVIAHVGRAGVHVHEHFADDEVHAFDHLSFVELAARLRYGALVEVAA